MISPDILLEEVWERPGYGYPLVPSSSLPGDSLTVWIPPRIYVYIYLACGRDGVLEPVVC